VLMLKMFDFLYIYIHSSYKLCVVSLHLYPLGVDRISLVFIVYSDQLWLVWCAVLDQNM
jgi:hypothetical protein